MHLELTGEDVTECTGGARGLTDADLQRAYRSQVDPRLNYEQALELAHADRRAQQASAPDRGRAAAGESASVSAAARSIRSRCSRACRGAPASTACTTPPANCSTSARPSSLRDRVGSYFSTRALAPKVEALVQAHRARRGHAVTDSETEALLLEYNLIKEHRPRFNIILRDDKSFPYIRLHRRP